MEMLSVLLALCEGNSVVDSPHKGSMIKIFKFFFVVSLIKLFYKQLCVASEMRGSHDVALTSQYIMTHSIFS